MLNSVKTVFFNIQFWLRLAFAFFLPFLFFSATMKFTADSINLALGTIHKPKIGLVAENNGIKKSDNGTKYYKILTEYPEIELYDDDSHPNANGSFLNACVFYQMLTEKKASELKYNGEIEPKTAELLKQIAE